MSIAINSVDIPFQVGQDVFIQQPFYYWSNNVKQSVPYFSGVIRSIEICIDPQSRFIRSQGQPIRLIIDLIRYEIQPHSHFNPFGQVQILDRILKGSKLFATEQALLTTINQSNHV